MTETEPVRGNIETLRLIDSLSSAEFRLRILLLGGPALTVLLVYGLLFPILWVSAYLAALLLYQSLLRRSLHTEWDRSLRWAYFVNFLTSMIYNGLAIQLWLTGERLEMLAAACLCLGTILHSVSQRARLVWIIIGDGVSNSAFFLVAFGTIIFGFETLVDRIIASLLLGAMLFYYISALTTAYGMRRRLKEVSNRSAAMQKMEAVGRLTGGVAHDFNNILTVVSGNLELYQTSSDPKERDQYAREAGEAAARASALVAQLLAFSRQSNLQPAALDLAEFLDSFWRMARRVLPEDIEIISKTPADQWPALVDPGKLDNALLNLVINARDAMGNGGGELRLNTANIELDENLNLVGDQRLPIGRYVQIVVSDTGEGIPKSIMNRIFDPFFTTKEVGKGSGMGLSMAKGFAEQSGGALIVESRPKIGTIISLILPAAAAKAGQ